MEKRETFDVFDLEFAKSGDTVDHYTMYEKLSIYGIDPRFIQRIKSTY